MHPNVIDLTGQRFKKLLVINSAGRNNGGRRLWNCQCDCGKIKTIREDSLKSGNTKSCGCVSIEKCTKHGMCRTPEYSSWEHMRQRCNNPNHESYMHYGGRGIYICKRWRDFKNFFADMGKKLPNSEIERIDNDGNYEPSNCKWATRTTQCRNTRILKKSVTGVRGVCFNKRYKKKYSASITVKHKTIYLGRFDTIAEAAEARRLGEIKYWG
jgi:hypothetical protein